MPRSDRYAALFFMALAVFFCQQSTQLYVGTINNPGPGLLPLGVGAGIGLLSLLLLIQTFVSAKKPAGSKPDEEAGDKVRTISICISLFIYVIAVDWLGFVLATLIYAFFLFCTVESESWWRSAIKALLITIGNYLVFVVWLGVRLPKGPLPW